MIDLTQLVRFIFGVIGSVLTIGLMAVLVPGVVKIDQNGSVGEDKPYALLEFVMHCMLWVFYGLPLVNEDYSIFVLTTGCFGLVIGATSLAVFFIHCGDKKNLRRFIVSRLLAEITGVLVIVLITLFAIESSSAKKTFVGVICNISFFVILLKGPLTSIIIAVETESVKHINIQCWLTFIGFLNHICWTAYSLIYKIDFCILINNVLGILVDASKLILYAYYKSTLTFFGVL